MVVNLNNNSLEIINNVLYYNSMTQNNVVINRRRGRPRKPTKRQLESSALQTIPIEGFANNTYKDLYIKAYEEGRIPQLRTAKKTYSLSLIMVLIMKTF